MKTCGLMIVAAVVCLSLVAYGQAVPGADPPAAQPAAPGAGAFPGGAPVPGAGPALPPKVMQYKNSFIKVGIPEEEATLLAVIMAGDIDPMKLMMLMGMKGGGKMEGEAMGMLMFSQAFQGGKGGQAPWFRDGEWMYVLDDSVLYKLNVETMQVDGKLAYKEDIEAEAMTMGMLVKAMMMGGGKVQPQQKAANAKRSAQLKQLGLAMHMALAETNGQFPGENWVAFVAPKVGDKSVLRCPAWPEAPVGYAMNDKLIDAKLGMIKEPARIVLLFETQVGGESPVGNAADVPMDPIMGQRMVGAAFVDGHVEMVDAAELQRRLQMNPFGG